MFAATILQTSKSRHFKESTIVFLKEGEAAQVFHKLGISLSCICARVHGSALLSTLPVPVVVDAFPPPLVV